MLYSIDARGVSFGSEQYILSFFNSGKMAGPHYTILGVAGNDERPIVLSADSKQPLVQQVIRSVGIYLDIYQLGCLEILHQNQNRGKTWRPQEPLKPPQHSLREQRKETLVRDATALYCLTWN